MKKNFYLFIVMLLSIFMVNSVNAKEVTSFGDNITQKGDYDSTRFIAGNNVVNKANIDGLSFVAGNDIKVLGKSSYDFIAGNNITIEENIEKDLFVAGNNINISDDSIIGRDAYIAGNTIVINTNVKRDLRVGGESVDLRGINIGGDAIIYANKIILDKDTIISGKFTYQSNTNVVGLKSANIGKIKVIESDDIENEDSIGDILFNFISSVSAGFIVVAALFFLLPNIKDKLNKLELDVSDIIKNIGIGLVVLIVVPIISLIALFSGVLAPISLIVIALYIIFIYIASLIVSYIVGRLLISKTLNKDNTYLALLGGIIIVKLIKLIPVIGGIVSVVVLLYGMGLIYKYIISIKKKSKK